MNGFIKKTLAGLCLGSGAFSLSGCAAYRDCVDPCYPQRYNYMAQQSVLQATNNQAANGHVLDQTVWNYFFETDPKTGKATDELNALGREHLAYIARRRPTPDPKLYLQTAQDVAYSPAQGPEKFAQARADLDNKRLQAVHKFLHAQTAGRNLGYDFQITVHDPGDVGLEAVTIGGNQPATVYRVIGAAPQLNGNFRGVLPAGATTGGGGTSGGGGTGGGGLGGSGTSSGGGGSGTGGGTSGGY
jgi:hypothetical protein